MSRDWTPRELHFADMMCQKETGKYLHDTTFVWILNGEKINPPEYENDIKKEFPNLSFLLDGFMNIYHEKYQNSECGKEVCMTIENELKEIIENDNDFNRLPPKDIHPHSVDDYGEISLDFVREWYLGKDSYYQDSNREEMFDNIDEAIGRYQEMLDIMREIEEEMSR